MNWLIFALVVSVTLLAVAYALIARRCPWVLGRKFRRGLFPLSGNPMTYGHIDIIRRAAHRCVELVVVLGKNPDKIPLFTPEERVTMAIRFIQEAGIENVRVVSDSGLQIDLADQLLCDAVFRGVRNQKDVAYEREQVALSSLFRPSFAKKVYFLRARPEWEQVSSTVVREYARYGSVVSQWTASFIEQTLVARLGRWHLRLDDAPEFLAKTAALADAIVAELATRNIKAKHVNFEQLRDRALNEDSPAGDALRNSLMSTSGNELETRLRKQAMRLYRAELLGYKGILIHTGNQDTFIHGSELDQNVMLHETLDMRSEQESPKAIADRICAQLPKDFPTHN